MKLSHSPYLLQLKPTLRLLLDELYKEYPYASVLATSVEKRSYSVSRSGSSVRASQADRGFVVRVHDGKSYVEYSANELTPETIPTLVEGIRSELLQMGESLEIGDFKLPDDEPLSIDSCEEVLIHPATFGDAGILARLGEARKAALAKDERIVDAPVFASWQEQHQLFLSRNRDLIQSSLWMNAGINLAAMRDEEVKSYYRAYSGLGGVEVLDGMLDDIPELVSVTVSLLDAEPMIPGEYDCICTPEVTGMIVHEAFGHGVEMDMFVKDRALAASYVGKQVASPLVTMHDGAAAARQTATYAFDDEGTEAKDTVVIDNGILVSGISDALTADRLGTAPTGNGRRESYRRKAYTRMTNTFFEGGTDKLEDMIASISYGFLLENATSGMEDPKNWGIQCMVNIAREIKDGRLSGRIFSPIVLTGYVPDLLCSISMMSETPILSGSGFCGKGYKEWVKVSDGGPYIKARIRLG